jgi:hypothetical protein
MMETDKLARAAVEELWKLAMASGSQWGIPSRYAPRSTDHAASPARPASRRTRSDRRLPAPVNSIRLKRTTLSE